MVRPIRQAHDGQGSPRQGSGQAPQVTEQKPAVAEAKADKHTQEPLRVTGADTFAGADIVISDAKGEEIGQTFTGLWGAGVAEKRAQRIVACVNALAGMNPEVVADVVVALRALLEEVDAWIDCQVLKSNVQRFSCKPYVDGRTALANIARHSPEGVGGAKAEGGEG